jgi:hypothetical protein
LVTQKRLKEEHMLVYIIHREKDGNFSMDVVNTSGVSLNYHATKGDQLSNDTQYNSCMSFKGIPIGKFIDSSFWFMLFRMLVYPGKENHAGVLYERLLP